MIYQQLRSNHSHTCLNLSRKFTNTEKHKNPKLTLLYLCLLLISQPPDINPNPGPSFNETKYDCGHCNEEVKWTDKGILCDNTNCEQWYHTTCQGIGDDTYVRLSDSKHISIGIACGVHYQTTHITSHFKLLTQ